MKALRWAAVLLLGMAAACAPGRRAAEPEAGPYERGVEVANFTRERVEIHYHLMGSSAPQYLGSVGSGARERFVLPEARVTTIYATTSDGRQIVSRANTVQIRRVRL